MSFDTEVLIIGAGLSGLGLAVQLIRQFGIRDFEIIEKNSDVGGTWFANAYPGCGCDVPSHFYSYSFALNPDWSRKYSMQPEIQRYFRSIAERYHVIEHVRFQSIVEKAVWDKKLKLWHVHVLNLETRERTVRDTKILISAVGVFSMPKDCQIDGVERFEGRIFHSAEWDQGFDWKGKEVIVVGNGCSATQFVPVMARGPDAVKKLTQFSQQAQYMSERQNPYYSSTFRAVMRYIPFVMRLYRAYIYWQMERDYVSFVLEEGRAIRENLKVENEVYVKRTAPSRYWDALIPRTEIGCKRKILDTDYLATLHKDNVELIPDDPIEAIVGRGVRTKSGREIHADAIVLATGFKTQQMLFPMDIVGRNNLSLNEHWTKTSQSVAQAYFGICVPDFPNFFIMMGPNAISGHLAVTFTSECQVNLILRLIAPIVRTLPSHRSRTFLPRFPVSPAATTTVEVKREAARADSAWVQQKAKKLVWSSGCVNWSVDPKTGMNSILYPDWQYLYWLRSVFYKRTDFVYREEESGLEVDPSGRLFGAGIFMALFGVAVTGVMLVGRRGVVNWLRNARS